MKNIMKFAKGIFTRFIVYSITMIVALFIGFIFIFIADYFWDGEWVKFLLGIGLITLIISVLDYFDPILSKWCER